LRFSVDANVRQRNSASEVVGGMQRQEKTILITGSTDGVGRRVAERMGRSGATVLVHGRDQVRAESLLSEIRRLGGAGTFYPADFSSLLEVRALAASVQRDHGCLDILVNNAGIGVGGSDRQVSCDGHELRFAVNYLSGFLLTRLLLPLLKTSRAARIVNVASVGQQPIDFADVMLTRGYGADAILQLAASAEMEGRTGLYFDGLRSSRANAQAYDFGACERLRLTSLELVGLPMP